MEPWPDIIGARNSEGHVVVGSKRSRSKRCKTRLMFHNPHWTPQVDYERYDVLACDVHWEVTPRTCSLLRLALMDLVNPKLKMKFESGCYVSQVLGCELYVYEAGVRGGIFPRFWWQLPYSVDHAESLAMAIHMEATEEKLVAFPDPRTPKMITAQPPQLDWQQRPRFMDDWEAYIAKLLWIKEVAGR